MSMESVPKDLRGLRACKLCSMVKVSWSPSPCVTRRMNKVCNSKLTVAGSVLLQRLWQLRAVPQDEGKQRNDPGLHQLQLRWVLAHGVSIFTQFSFARSVISVMIPQESWVSKWQRIGEMKQPCPLNYIYFIPSRPPPSLLPSAFPQIDMYQVAMRCQWVATFLKTSLTLYKTKEFPTSLETLPTETEQYCACVTKSIHARMRGSAPPTLQDHGVWASGG